MALNPNREIQRLRESEDRLADKITGFAGSLRFVRFHIVWFSAWIAFNVGLVGTAVAFDPYPFGLLTLVVSLEAIFLSTFVMISQNRQAAAAEIRSEMDYRTNMMSEREIDIVLKGLQRISMQLGIDATDLVDELEAMRETYVMSADGAKS